MPTQKDRDLNVVQHEPKSRTHVRIFRDFDTQTDVSSMIPKINKSKRSWKQTNAILVSKYFLIYIFRVQFISLLFYYFPPADYYRSLCRSMHAIYKVFIPAITPCILPFCKMAT